MTTSDFNPVSWNGEPITTAKLNQMCNNTQWMFDRMPRVRYATNNINRDTTVKIIAGSTPFPPDNVHDYVNVDISFGSYFTAGCHPVITATVEVTGGNWRKLVSIQGLGGGQTDYTGFRAQVHDHESIVSMPIYQGGWIHWIAVGY